MESLYMRGFSTKFFGNPTFGIFH